jgi:hypothetical protein
MHIPFYSYSYIVGFDKAAKIEYLALLCRLPLIDSKDSLWLVMLWLVGSAVAVLWRCGCACLYRERMRRIGWDGMGRYNAE